MRPTSREKQQKLISSGSSIELEIPIPDNVKQVKLT
jgi:hypothetical protein